MTSRLALRLRDDVLAVIDVSPRALRAIAEEAAYRRTSVERLLSRLLSTLVENDQFALILDGDDKG